MIEATKKVVSFLDDIGVVGQWGETSINSLLLAFNISTSCLSHKPLKFRYEPYQRTMKKGRISDRDMVKYHGKCEIIML